MEEILVECEEMPTPDSAFSYLERLFKQPENTITDTDSLVECLISIDEQLEITFEDVDLLEINLGKLGNEIIEAFEQAEEENPNIKLI